MSVRAHGYKVATLLLRPFHDFFDRLPVAQLRRCGNVRRSEFCLHLLQVGAAALYLFTPGLGALELYLGAGRNMQQQHSAMHDSRELLDVIDDRPVRR